MTPYDIKVCNILIKNRKYFVSPPKDGSDFKELFKYLVSVGAGLPADKDGVPIGSWTPELLANAISQIDANTSGVDLRTVQHWFQDNDKGIGPENTHWLARVFGCGDPDETIAWRAELTAANRQSIAKRKKKREASKDSRRASIEQSLPVPYQGNPILLEVKSRHDDAGSRKQPFSLTEKTEDVFYSRSSMNLPVIVFAAAAALGLISFTLNIHSVYFSDPSGLTKQVGFLWAPNWTITFLAVLPIYLALLVDLLKFWKREWRSRLVASRDPAQPMESWGSRMTAASFSYWTVLILTLVIASGFNWTATHLMPLLDGDPGSWPMDWGRIAIVRPDVISIPSAIFFTGMVFLYNAACSYLFFAGLVFLHAMTHDFLDITRGHDPRWKDEGIQEVEAISFALMNGIFRCTALGLVITILMKLQSSFLVSDSPNILSWLMSDIRLLFSGYDPLASKYDSRQSAPGLYYSFFCVLAIFAVYLNASVRIRLTLAHLRSQMPKARFFSPWGGMDGTMVLLVVTYLLIGELPGFALLLIASSIVTTYLIFKPALGWEKSSIKEA